MGIVFKPEPLPVNYRVWSHCSFVSHLVGTDDRIRASSELSSGPRATQQKDHPEQSISDSYLSLSLSLSLSSHMDCGSLKDYLFITCSFVTHFCALCHVLLPPLLLLLLLLLLFLDSSQRPIYII